MTDFIISGDTLEEVLAVLESLEHNEEVRGQEDGAHYLCALREKLRDETGHTWDGGEYL